MNNRKTLAEELSIIPVPARVIAVIVYAVFSGGLFWVLNLNPNDPPWPFAVKAVFAVLVPVPLTCFVLVVGYVNADARRRGMRYVLWTLLAIFVPNLIGILLYFLLRDPMPVYCPHCGAAVRPGFPHCPRCGAQLTASCHACGKPAESGWSHCAYCGAKL